MARLTSPPRLDPRWRQALDDHVIALGWSPDGTTLAAASVAGPITLFDVSAGTVRHTLAGHGFGTAALAWHPDGKRLATAGQDGKVRLWDAGTGQRARGARRRGRLGRAPGLGAEGRLPRLGGRQAATAVGRRTGPW